MLGRKTQSSTLRRAWSIATLVGALTLCLVTRVQADAGPKTIVKAAEAVVYERADTAGPARLTIKIGSVVQVRRENGLWCDVSVPTSPSGRTVDGWMLTADLVRSPGMARFWEGDVRTAAALLRAELDATTDPVIGPWLQFFLGYSQWASGQLDLARTTFDAVAQRRPAGRFSADAYVAAAKVASIRGNVEAALARYEQMLVAFPAYRTSPYRCDAAVDPYPMEWDHDSEMTVGNPAIPLRIQALRALNAAKAAADLEVAAAGATPLRKATAWYSLGRAWEEKNQVDPGETMLRGMLTGNTDARTHYEVAVKTAPGFAPAGLAAWRLIALSAPYEWEGDWEAQAAWMIDNYGKFLADYPRHELAPEARFQVALGTWAKGGYTEVFHYVFDPDGWDAVRNREAVLEQWFDTRGFGGEEAPE